MLLHINSLKEFNLFIIILNLAFLIAAGIWLLFNPEIILL